MKKTALILTLTLFAALPAFAGYFYKSRSYQEGDNASDQMRIETEAWVEGQSAKILFTSSGSPLMPSGSYLLTTDGGQKIFLVNPEEQTYSEWDLEAFFGMASAIMKGMGPLLKFKFSDPKVETLVQEPGGMVAGQPTTHYRFRTTYTIEMKVLGMKNTQSVEQLQDVWAAEHLTDPAMNVWLYRDPPDLGDSGLKQLIEAEKSKLRGVPLKTILEETSTGKKGKQTVTRTVTEVFEFDERSIAAATFEMEPGLTEVPMLPTGELAAQQGEPEEEEEKPKRKGLRGLLRGDG